MKRTFQTSAIIWACVSLFHAQRAVALVYCATNVVDEHRVEPVGALANSGWNETAEIDQWMGTVIYSNAMLTAQHLRLGVYAHFDYEGTRHTVTAVALDEKSDFTILFFTPAVTNFARINIETNDICSLVVLQGRGTERGEEVVTGGHTNGWKWGEVLKTRRWGVNRYFGEDNYSVGPTNGVLAVAAFDAVSDPDECMLTDGDSGGPGFIQTGSGWKLATVNYAVGPDQFTFSTNPISAFHAALCDCAGLYYYNGSTWCYTPTNESPAPCLMANTRTAKRIDWITNTVPGITFPADIGVGWRCETNQPSGRQAAEGLWFEVVVANAGPYTARELALDVVWSGGVRIRNSTASQGSFLTNRWSLPALGDGAAATLRVDAVVWRAAAGWGTNRVSVSGSDKPDGVASNNSAAFALHLPATATRFMVE
jgi:hypothetical protein